MKKYISRLLIIVFGFSASIAAQAGESVKVTDAWIPEAPPVVKVMAGYLKISNPTSNDVVINQVTSADFETVEIHQTVEKDGMARMLKQDKLVVPAGSEVIFKRGGLHLMLINKKRALKKGDKVELNFSIATDAGTGKLKASAEVKEAAIDDHSHHHHH